MKVSVFVRFLWARRPGSHGPHQSLQQPEHAAPWLQAAARPATPYIPDLHSSTLYLPTGYSLRLLMLALGAAATNTGALSLHLVPHGGLGQRPRCHAAQRPRQHAGRAGASHTRATLVSPPQSAPLDLESAAELEADYTLGEQVISPQHKVVTSPWLPRLLARSNAGRLPQYGMACAARPQDARAGGSGLPYRSQPLASPALCSKRTRRSKPPALPTRLRRSAAAALRLCWRSQTRAAAAAWQPRSCPSLCTAAKPASRQRWSPLRPARRPRWVRSAPRCCGWLTCDKKTPTST